jgi:hypothetical protein
MHARKPLVPDLIRYKAMLLLLLSLLTSQADARDRAQRTAFFHDHPCPATSETHGACPGWVVDHITPLCAGGADDPGNMQWQELAESKVKDKEEWRTCRLLRKQRLDASAK